MNDVRDLNVLRDRISALETALRPFAEFARVQRAPMRGIDDVLYAVRAGGDDMRYAEIRFSDCARALDALEEK